MSMIRYLCMGAGVLLAATVWAAPAGRTRDPGVGQPAGGVEQHLVRGLKHHPTELLVKFRANVTPDQAEHAARASGAVAVRAFKRPRVLKASPIDQWRVVRAGRGADLQRLRAALLKNPKVETVEFNVEVKVNLTPADPEFGALWGMHNAGQTGGVVDADIDAPEAWDQVTGDPGIVVAVIDTGLARNHPDLQGNVWVNAGEVPGNGLDDDANGYVDDVYGYDFYNNDADPNDDHGHGTHVAGTIAATGNNGIGVVGVSWQARLMGLKFLGADGSGFSTGAIGAVLYAADMGARVMNNSWGGGGFSQALLDAILTADQVGALFVAAAGNAGSNNDVSPHYPSGYEAPNVVAVAATNSGDGKASFSNYGATSVDLGAPGEGIYSTVPTVGNPCCSHSSGYMMLSGTSMATPHVSGAAALVMARYPGISHHDTKARLLGNGDPLSALAGITATGRRLNVAQALETDTTPPAAVFDLLVNGAAATTVNLGWTATGDDGFYGAASSYELRYATYPLDDTNFTTGVLAGNLPKPATAGAAESVTVTGLAPVTTYYFALKVIDNAGNASGLSNPVNVTTANVKVVFKDDMEAGPANWTVSGSDGMGGPALWHLSAHRAGSPTTAFYYGRESTLNYDTGAANQGSITSPLISLKGARGSRLSFKSFLQTENQAPYDTARVSVSADGGFSWADLYTTSIGSGGTMSDVDLDLSVYDEQDIQIRFSFNTVDAVLNGFEGWVVDDVQILAADAGDVTPPAPVTDLQAVSVGATFADLTWSATADDAYTGGPASAYELRYAPFPIDATNFEAATPAPDVPLPGPLGAGETYRLGGLLSGNTYFVAVRVLDDAGNRSDISNVLTLTTPPAYFSTVFFDDMESGPVRWTVTGSDGLGGAALWHVSPHRSASPTNAMYYGRDTTLTYETGARNFGEITSMPIDLSGIDGARLSFQHYLATENLAPYDRAQVLASKDNGATWDALLATSLGTGGAMVPVDLDLAAYAGQQILIRFSFDTVDSAFNGFEGWVIDDVAVTGWSSAPPNMPPVASVAGPYTSYPGEPVTFDASGSFDPEGQPLTFLWDFGDGSQDTSPQPTHVYMAKGHYTVTLTVSDGVQVGTGMTEVMVMNRAPLANAGGPYTMNHNVPLMFDASASVDPDGDPLTYFWDFGDGSFGFFGPNPTHAYEHSGSYPVVLVVSDGELSEMATTTVTVINQTPVANAGGPYSVSRNKPLVFDASASADLEGDPLTFWWDFGDGSTASGVSPSHVYTASGTYLVTLQVSDAESVGVATTTVTVTNQDPVANAGGPYTVAKNQVLQLSAAGSSDPDGDPLTYQWEFGDGTTGTGPNPVHVYTMGGDYVVSVLASDGEAVTPAQTTVTVLNQLPVARISGPIEVFKNDPVVFDGSASSDADGDALGFGWDFGAGFMPPSTSPLGNTSFAAVGSYPVQLIVYDGEASSSPATHLVSVLSRPPVADAGSDSTVAARSAVMLDGGASSDPDGTLTGYAWRQVAGPAVTLSNANTSTVGFTAPNVTGTGALSLVFELTVTDSDGVKASDLVTVTVVKKL